MADPELMKILNQGSEAWNRWRDQIPQKALFDLEHAFLVGEYLVEANLSSVNLQQAELTGAKLYNANLSYSNLRGADFVGADLSFAKLCHTLLNNAEFGGTDLSHADLSYSDLQGADLSYTNLSYANLCYADLRGADLNSTNLCAANLFGSNLCDASIHDALFISVDLRATIGLHELNHKGPSHITLGTIQLPQDSSALHFLRGCGVADEWIDFYRSQMMNPIQYHSCFISYCSQDEIIAHRLHADLQAKGIRCWFAPHDMKIGDKIRPHIDEAIHLQDKLLLILSEKAVNSDWVEHEVETALARERRENRTILFPIRIDNAILVRSYIGWAATVQNERHIGDFTGWKDHDCYQVAFDRLMRDLKQI